MRERNGTITLSKCISAGFMRGFLQEEPKEPLCLQTNSLSPIKERVSRIIPLFDTERLYAFSQGALLADIFLFSVEQPLGQGHYRSSSCLD